VNAAINAAIAVRIFLFPFLKRAWCRPHYAGRLVLTSLIAFLKAISAAQVCALAQKRKPVA
jgi:hypothetical protein